MPKLKKKSELQKQQSSRRGMQLRRQQDTVRILERTADAEARRLSRRDTARRREEQTADTEARRVTRQDTARRREEQIANTEARRVARQDAVRRIEEQTADTEARRVTRQDTARRREEQTANTEARRVTRQDAVRRRGEQTADTEARRVRRTNPARRRAEQEADTEARRKIRRDSLSSYENLLIKYNEQIRCAPSFICSCCGRLWYEDSTSITSHQDLQNAGCSKDFISSVLNVKQSVHRFCGTCKSYAKRKVVPRLSLANGFTFPDIPACLQGLSPLEERLVSLRLPFMQIRLLGAQRQSALRGNVVNVENDLDICVKTIPRRFNEMSTVQVQLMRRMQYRTPYMHETIRPFKVYNAAKYLLNTELYQSQNVLLSENWQTSTEDETINFICNATEMATTNEEEVANDASDGSSEAGIEDAGQANPNIGADETLIYAQDNFQQGTFGIRIAPGEGKIPIPLHHDRDAEVLSFPSIYCGQRRKFKQGLRISYTDIAKSELTRYDRRACLPSKILYSFKRSFNEKVAGAIQVCLRKRTGDKFNAGSALNPGYIQNLINNDDGYAVFKHLRSSPSYWKEKSKKVLAMVRQLGKPSFFITFSAAETKWTELLVMLHRILKNEEITEEDASQLTFDAKADLIRKDPVTCMVHFDHRFRMLLNTIMKKEAGVFNPYELEDHFSRLEFQMRGSPHSHGLYWIKDAPEYIEEDHSSEDACIKFIDEFITCDRNEADGMENLIGYQIHKHSHTCRKRGKISCRFDFPKPPMDKTRILLPLPNETSIKQKRKACDLYQKLQKTLNDMGRSYKEDIDFDTFLHSLGSTNDEYIMAVRSSIRRTTVFLRRKTNAIFVNGYNTKLLQAWGANIDFQFVLDTYACAKYCVGYILKAEGGVSKLLQAVTRDVRRGNTGIRDQLKKFANILINGTEISAQEAAAFLLGIPNTMCSRTDIFINTAQRHERIQMLKSRKELEQLPSDSMDVCAKGILHRYSERPKELETVCLAEFASMYNKQTNRKSANNKEVEGQEAEPEDAEFEDTGIALFDDQHVDTSKHSAKYSKRRIRKIIRYRHYGKSDLENYHREQLMLYIPWRNEQEELLSVNIMEKAEELKHDIMENSKPFVRNPALDDFALGELIEEIENTNDQHNWYVDEDLEAVLNDTYFDPDFVEEIGNPKSRVEKFLIPKLVNEEDYFKIMRSLNEKQNRFVLNLLHLIKCSKSPFYFFLSGGAGVGKSHAITATVQSYLRYSNQFPNTNPNEVCVLVSAPTGKAAFNVFGMTLHCTFKLPPVQQRGPICDLEDSAVNSLRLKLASTKLFIIDEISMVSVKMLYDINQRLRQIFCTHEDFGGRSLLVVGHLRQLPPVIGQHVFKLPKDFPLGECAGNYLWNNFFLYELDEIMRQKGDLKFCKALNNMAEGCMDEEDVELIKRREIDSSNKPHRELISLFRTNDECKQYNNAIHEELNSESATSIAYDKIQGKGTDAQIKNMLETAKNLKVQQCDGLPYQTHLQVGGEYFVSTNISVEDGLFNGSTGCLKLIEYKTTPNGIKIPIRAWMDFRNSLIGIEKKTKMRSYQQQNSSRINPDWVPIDRFTRNLSFRVRGHGLQIVRNQIPLVAANGMTIAKSQGSTLDGIIVNVTPHNGKGLSRELLYVACSRSRTYEGLYINGEFEPPEPPPPNDAVTLEMARLREMPFPWRLRFLQDYDDTVEKLYFHNVQSFNLHCQDVVADHCCMNSGFLAFVEPHLISSDHIDVPGYNCLYRRNCNSSRNSEGVLLLGRNKSTGGLQPNIQYAAFQGTNNNGHCLFLTYKTGQVAIIVSYKHPKYPKSEYLVKLDQTLSNTSQYAIFVGDINIDLKTGDGVRIVDVFKKFGLVSKLNIEDPSTDGQTHIDCCFSNVGDSEAWFYESYYSYHKPICVVWPKANC